MYACVRGLIGKGGMCVCMYAGGHSVREACVCACACVRVSVHVELAGEGVSGGTARMRWRGERQCFQTHVGGRLGAS